VTINFSRLTLLPAVSQSGSACKHCVTSCC